MNPSDIKMEGGMDMYTEVTLVYKDKSGRDALPLYNVKQEFDVTSPTSSHTANASHAPIETVFGVRKFENDSIECPLTVKEESRCVVKDEMDIGPTLLQRSYTPNNPSLMVGSSCRTDLPQPQQPAFEAPRTKKRRREFTPSRVSLLNDLFLPKPSAEDKETKPVLSSTPIELISGESSGQNSLGSQNCHPFLQCGCDDDIFIVDDDDFGHPVRRRIIDTLPWSDDDEDDVTLDPPLQRRRTSPNYIADSKEVATYLPNNLFHFDWKQFPEDLSSAEPRRETFQNINIGATAQYSRPYDAFVAIWDMQFIEYIVSETNKHAQQIMNTMLSDGSLHPNSRLTKWRDTTVDEIYVYLAIVASMGIVIKSDITEYWSSKEGIFSTAEFSIHMSYCRFLLLNRCLQFTDSSSVLAMENLDASQKKLFKIQPVLDHLNARFQGLYNLGQNIALDESLLHWKGYLKRTKPEQVEIKSCEVCEPETGYLWRFEIHARQQVKGEDATYKTDMVLRLLRGLENKGHTVWLDSTYNSPALARKLKSMRFDCVGRVRTNRQFVPKSLRDIVKRGDLKLKDVDGVTSGDVDLLLWRHKKVVSTISTYHGNAVATDATPNIIHDYNTIMGSVDRNDRMLAMYPIERKHTKIWYHKLFRRLLNVSILNAYNIYKSSGHQSVAHRMFRKTLVFELLSIHSKPAVQSTPPPTVRGMFYDAREHFIACTSHPRVRRVCVVCHKRSSKYCAGCQKHVCGEDCFRKMHL